VQDAGQNHWAWDGLQDFPDWQNNGHDVNGTVDNNLDRTSSYYCPECAALLAQNRFITHGIN
jgi:hypothetical protein